MSSISRNAIFLTLAITGTSLPAAHSQKTAQTKSVPSSVSGRVTIHGKAAAGIAVGLGNSDFSPQPNPALKAITDQDGNYRITKIPAGNYRVAPMSPAYVVSDLAFPRAGGKMLLLAEGEDVQGIDFSIVRGGAITGKVTDADGRAVIEERLNLMAEDQFNSGGQIFPKGMSGAVQTDDRGVYRIYGIPPGRYRVSVGVGDDQFSSGTRVGRVAYKRTFYPNAADPDEARVIEVTEGSETTNIDITVGRNLPTFAASGRVVDGETGLPVAGWRFALRRIVNDRETRVAGMFVMSNNQGEFRLENITPGKYAVLAIATPGSEARVDPVPFEVIDQDVTGLLLKTIKGLTITGNVVLEGTYDKSIFTKLTQLHIQAYVDGDNASFGSGQGSPINAEGGFRLGGLEPGIANFSLHAPDRQAPLNFVILRIEHNGVVQPHGVEIKSGGQTEGVKIIVGSGTGSVRGEVQLEHRPLPSEGRIIVWISKSDAPESTSRSYNLDARGHFLIEGLAAGSYELDVNANIPGRRTPLSARQQIEVSEGTVTVVLVNLDLLLNP